MSGDHSLPEGVPGWAWEAIGAVPQGDGWAIPERNAEGEVIGWSIRRKDGSKSFRSGGQRGLTLKWPLEAYAGASESDPLFVVEGASDAAAGMGLSLDMVGRPSASVGGGFLAVLLAGRHVCLIADNDKGAGHLGARKIAAQLGAACATVRIIAPPRGIKDLRAWVIAGATREDVLALAHAATAMKPCLTEEDARIPRSSSAAENERSPATAELIVRMAEEHFRLGRSSTDEPFAVCRRGPNVAVMLRGSSEALRAVLSRDFRKALGRVPSASAVADAMVTLQGMAQDAEPEPVALRVAEHDGGIVLDLGGSDGRAVVIRPGGWEVVEPSPVLFRRTALTAALPAPERGGDLASLRDILNVADDSWPLFVGFLVAAYFASIAHPVLMLGGLQGTGKTTAGGFLWGLFDPSAVENHNVPRDPEAWAMAANGSWGVLVDNVSGIPDWWADALCKAVTGAGWVKRAHYENYNLSVLSFRRVVMLTSIDTGALRGDLADRLLIVDLEPIPPDRRRPESELKQLYAARRPAILGALLDLTAAVLRELPAVELTSMPRMADFARILAAMDRALGTNALNLYLAQGTRIADDVVDGDPVGEALAALVRRQGSWSGTAAELLDQITPEKRPHHWPRSARGMAGCLKRLIPALALLGIEVVPPGKDDRPRRYTMRLTVGIVESSGNRGDGGSDEHRVPSVGDSWASDQGGTGRPTSRLEIPYLPVEDAFSRSDGTDGRMQAPSAPTRCLLNHEGRYYRFADQEGWNCEECHPPLPDAIVEWWHGGW